MESRIIFGLGVSFVFGFARWIWPTMPKPLAAFGFATGFGLLAWAAFPLFDRFWAAALIVLFAILAAVITALVRHRAKLSQPNASTPPVKSTFIDASDGGEVDIEDCYSSAETFANVKGAKFTARGSRHEPS